MKIHFLILLGFLLIVSFLFLPVYAEPIDIRATIETRNLLTNLREIAKKGIMFGHQDALAYGVNWKNKKGRSDVKSVVGDFPAVVGWDIGHLELGREQNLDSVSFKDMRRWIKKVYQSGGVNTISWHADNPISGGSSWETSPAVVSILPEGSHHHIYLAWLDRLAGFFLSLKGNRGEYIPVVFRPFHEQTGSWFWWGRGHCTKEQYIQLWQFTIDYLTVVKNVHNVLYAYSTDVFNSREEYLMFYPGDDYVDILGFDDYHSIKSIETLDVFVKRLNMLTSIASEKEKVAIFSETGLETIPDPNWWTGVLLNGLHKMEPKPGIAWVLVWRNAWPSHHYAPYPGHVSGDDFKAFYRDKKIFFLKDIPSLYSK
ncbi:MAG: beta-mannosidase [Cyclobacteriaceae bacterium]|nr:beta-mannosidase [Cyclobacteriaceae bacterium]